MKQTIATSSIAALAMLAATLGQTARAQSDTASATPAAAASDHSLEDCCYLGVATSIAPAMLRAQLNLPHGVGLVIDDIDPESPARDAGLQVHDVIEQLNDQLIINVQQFSVLVRMQKPNQPIQLKVIRHGQPIDVNVTLATRPMPALDEAPNWLRVGMPIPRAGVGRVTGIVTHSDSTSTITIIAREDDRQVIIRDRQGKTLFDGPLNTPDDHAKLPAEYRDKVLQIEKNSAAHFKELRNALQPQTAPASGE